MFGDDNHSELVPESTQSGGFLTWTIVDNLTKNSKVDISYYHVNGIHEEIISLLYGSFKMNKMYVRHDKIISHQKIKPNS